MDEPEIVPDKISNPINRRVILGILIMGLGMFITLNIISEDDAGIRIIHDYLENNTLDLNSSV